MAMSTRPRATATADPELEPPEILSGRLESRTAPCGLRVPTRPVANWSRLVAPSTRAPAARSLATGTASRVGVPPKPGHAAVVVIPATSTLFLTASRRPASGRFPPAATAASTRAASASSSSRPRRWIQISGRSTASIASSAESTRETVVPVGLVMMRFLPGRVRVPGRPLAPGPPVLRRPPLERRQRAGPVGPGHPRGPG